MTLATQTLEVIGLRRKNDTTVVVELGSTHSASADGTLAPQTFGSHLIEVGAADAPGLRAAVTLTFSVQA